MATLTREQYEALRRQGRGTFRGQTSSSGQFVIEADKFVGDLQGNADTATRLRDPITISLGGDADGSAQFAGSSFRLDATIRNSEHAEEADVAENARHSAQASHADLANIATLALRSILANNATHADKASNADNADHSDEATHADSASSASRATYDSNGDNIHNTFVNKQQQITSNTNLLSNHTTTIADHERRITNNKNQIEDLDTRVSDIETSTDVGKITQRIVNIETKNTEQDNRLDAINDTMVTLTTAQYVSGIKRFNQSKVEMSNAPIGIDVTNKDYVDNKTLSSSQWAKDYTDNRILSSSTYVTNVAKEYTDNRVLSSSQYVDDHFMSLTKSQYVTGLNTFEKPPRTDTLPVNNNDLVNKQYTDAEITEAINMLNLFKRLPSYKRDNLFTVTKTTVSTPTNLFININNKTFCNFESTVLNLSDSDAWDNSSYVTASNRKGKDFYIYALETDTTTCNFILSVNSTVPTGYTADNSRKIGGFHCLCADVGTPTYYDQVSKTDKPHWLSGYIAGDILPLSIWDLLFRADSENEGMVYDSGRDVFIDIYLTGYDGSQLISQFGATIVDGTSSFPMHGEKFAEFAHKVKKRLIDRDTFIEVAKGSNEKTNISGSTDPVTTGGHVDTSNRRMISNIGLEDCCGALWQWVYQSGGANGSSNWQNTVSATPIDASAGQFGQSYGAYYRALVGGGWSNGASCGSRCVGVDDGSAHVSASFGGRLVAKRRIVNSI